MKFQNPNTDILKDKSLFVFDMDGTIYLGEKAFPFAVDFIRKLHESDRRILYFTNNASHSVPFYMEKLERLGFEPRENEVMTAGDVLREYLLHYKKGKTVYLLGTDDLKNDYRKAGIPLLDGTEPKADIVVTSFDTSLTYDKLTKACRYIWGGAEYLSTHPDKTCPTDDGYLPDSGAISAFITTATDVVPTYFGKPYQETAQMICETTGVAPENICIFGDRLMTDIAIGKNFGITSILVLTGENTAEDAMKLEKKMQPDYIFDSLADVTKVIFGK